MVNVHMLCGPLQGTSGGPVTRRTHCGRMRSHHNCNDGTGARAAGIKYTASKSGRPAIFFRDPDENCLEVVELAPWR